MTEPIQISFDVDCAVDHAFDVWTARISSWWPRSHTVSAQDDADVVLERRVGGRIYERTTVADEHDSGEVTRRWSGRLARPQLRRLGDAAPAVPRRSEQLVPGRLTAQRRRFR